MQQNRVFEKRILVVEDDPSARQSMTLLLNIDRHTVTEAEDGKAALARVGHEPFDLVVLDYFMPGMQGGEVAMRMKDIDPCLPIIMVSAFLEKLRDQDQPVDGMLGKPFA